MIEKYSFVILGVVTVCKIDSSTESYPQKPLVLKMLPTE